MLVGCPADPERIDSGSPPDAGTDAEVPDGGSDAGPSCAGGLSCDLSIDSVGVPTPSPIDTGQMLEIRWRVVNRGEVGYDGYELAVHYGTGDSVSEDDPVLCTSRSETRLSPSVSVEESVSCAAPETPGEYTLGVLIDSDDAYVEADEDNNFAFASRSITVRPPLPDLRVDAVSCIPDPVNGGAMLACNVLLANGGGSDAPASQVDLYLSMDATIDGTDMVLASCTAPAVAAGGNELVACAGVVPPATATASWFVGAVADPAASVEESDETNNTGSTSVMVMTGLPDIAVDSVSCSPTQGEAGAPVSCTIGLRNPGVVDTGPFSVSLRLSTDGTIDTSDPSMGSCMVSSVAAGGSASATCAGTVPTPSAPGARSLGVIADSDGTVLELDETNNTASTLFTVPTSSDLVVDAVVCTPTTVTPNGDISCRVDFTNTGMADTGPFVVDLRVSTNTVISTADALVSTCSVAGVAGGASGNVTCMGMVPSSTTAGMRYAGARLDTTSQVSESNEGNNTGSQAITVVDQPDLVVDSVSCPASATGGQFVSCTIGFRNAGSQPMPASSYELRLSTNTIISTADALVATCTVGSIAAGATVTDSCSGRLPSNVTNSTRYLGVRGDSGAAAAEANEGNNSGYTAIAVTETIDLLATAVSCPSSVNDGSVISCTITLRNDGRLTSGTSFSTELRMSTNTIISTADTLIATCVTSTLPGLTTRTLTCAGVVPAGTSGTRYFGARVDSTSAVSEGNEVNNDDTYDTVTVN